MGISRRAAGTRKVSQPLPTEHQEQVALYQWRDAQLGRWPELALMFAIPNGSHKSPAMAVWFKREGLTSGVPDNFLSVPRGYYHGMYIEMKRREGGRLSEEQKKFTAELAAHGYAAVIANGWEEAAEMIENYMKLGPFTERDDVPEDDKRDD